MYQQQVSFKDAVVRALTVNYCNFEGRSSRSEYWWFCLFTFILGAVVSVIFSFSETLETIVTSVVWLALLLPSIGVGVRRLHDIGRTGWWLLISFIPLVGAILLIIWFVRDSDPQPNQYGPVPNLA
ncbi:MAG: DUF805 domain-containing protein [Muribaculaceae bacterium]|nr:DUF805 domain-containing protein [Muribaculaceae bacterium]